MPEAQTGRAQALQRVVGPALADAEQEAGIRKDEFDALASLSGRAPIIADDLCEHFRSELISVTDARGELSGIATKMQGRLVNPELASLLKPDRIAGICAQMEEVAALFPDELQAVDPNGTVIESIRLALHMTGQSEVANALGTPDARKREQGDDTAYEYKRTEFERKVSEFGHEIESAEIPEEVRVRLQTLHAAIVSRRYPASAMQAISTDIMNRYAYPVQKAASQTIENLGTRSGGNLVGITETQWMIARGVWESQGTDLANPVLRGEGGLQRLGQWLLWHATSPDAYRAKGRWVNELPIVGYSGSMADIRAGWKTKVVSRSPDKRPVATKIPRPVAGWASFSLRTYAFVGMGVGAILGARPTWWNPTTYPAYGTRPLMAAMHIEPMTVESRSIIAPWTWTMGLKSDERVVRVLDDSYDIPEKLAERGAAYYQKAYGFGFPIGDETGAEGVKGRAEFLKGQPELIRFMQERSVNDWRTKPMRVMEWTELSTGTDLSNPDVCTFINPHQKKNDKGAGLSNVKPVPPNCEVIGWQGSDAKRKQAVVSLSTKEAVGDYRPVATLNDGWTPKNRVCCTISVHYEAIADGRVLNAAPGTGDRIVELINTDLYEIGHDGKRVANEKGKRYIGNDGRIKREYFDEPETVLRFVNEGILITQDQSEIMRRYKFAKVEDVDFMISKRVTVQVPLLSMCRRGENATFIKPENRDAFAELWMGKVRAEAPSLNPVVDDVPADVLKKTLEQAVSEANAKGLTEDTTREFQRNEMGKRYSRLKLKEPALDVLVARSDINKNSDISAVIDGYEAADSKYRINVDTSTEFVLMMAQGKPADFAGAGSDSPGPRAGFTISRGYVLMASQETKAAPAEAESTPAQNAVTAETVNTDADAFWASPENDGFNKFVSGNVIERLHTDKGGEGKIMAEAQTKAFGGSLDKMDHAIRNELYRVITSPDEAGRRKDWGVGVSGEGKDAAAKVTSIMKARNGITMYVFNWVKGEAQK